MDRTIRYCGILVCVAVVLIATSYAGAAATYTWTIGGSGNWSDANNWIKTGGGTGAPGASDTAVFDFNTVSSPTVNIPGTLSVAALTMSGSGALDIASTGGALTVVGDIQVGDGTNHQTLTAGNGAVVYSGNIYVNSSSALEGYGTFTQYVNVQGGTVDFTNATVYNIQLGANCDPASSYTGTSTIHADLLANIVNLTIGTFSGNHTIYATDLNLIDTVAFSSSGTVHLSGSGFYMNPSGDNIYGDPIYGHPSVSGNAEIDGDVYVWGGSFTGNHKIVGHLQVGDYTGDGSFPVISPHDSSTPIGTLTVTAGMTLDSSSVLDFNLGHVGASDLIIVGGDLTLDGTLNVTALDGFGNGIYKLFTYTGDLTDNTLVLGDMPAGYSYSLLDVAPVGDTPGYVALQVPEPATLALLALGGLAMLRRRK